MPLNLFDYENPKRKIEVHGDTILRGLDDAEWRTFLEFAERQMYPANVRILRQGDIDRTFYTLESGHVGVVIETPQGSTVVATIGPGSVFGARVRRRRAAIGVDRLARSLRPVEPAALRVHHARRLASAHRTRAPVRSRPRALGSPAARASPFLTARAQRFPWPPSSAPSPRRSPSGTTRNCRAASRTQCGWRCACSCLRSPPVRTTACAPAIPMSLRSATWRRWQPGGLWPIAVEQGRVTVAPMLGAEAAATPPRIVLQLKSEGIDLRSFGSVEPVRAGCEVVTANPGGVVWWRLVRDGGRVTGAVFVGPPGSSKELTTLLRDNTDVTPFLPALRKGELALRVPEPALAA